LNEANHASGNGRYTRLLQYVNRTYLRKWVTIGLLIGIVAGFGATAFYFMIQVVTNGILGSITGFYPPNPAGEPGAISSIVHPRYFLIPVSTMIGGLIAGLIVYNFAPEAEGHGTDAAIDAYHNKGGMIRRRIPIVKMIASAFTIGTGGSAGREGPTAQIAAGFGSILGDLFKLSTKDRRIALAAGIGAGIGSIFKSPFGGAILSAEILYRGPDMEAESLIPAFIATPIGYVIFASFTGFTPIFGYTAQYSFTQPFDLIVYALLGALCAGFGRLYTISFYKFKQIFDHMRVPKYLKPMIGAGIAGIIAVFFPQVVGLGYGFLQFLIDGDYSQIAPNYFPLNFVALTLLLLVFLKIFATSVTVGSGGSGGVFAPALAIGGFSGAFVWMLVNYLLPGAFPSAAPLVVIGMMALFGGVGRAPIAVILMVTEMTGSLALIAPAMVAVVISYFLVGPKYTIYKSQVLSRADSPAHMGEYNVSIMSRLKVAEAMRPNVISLTPDDTVDSAFSLMTEKKFRGLPVVNSATGQIEGMVTISDILRVPSAETKKTPLKSVMSKNVVSAFPDENLLNALAKMTTGGFGRLPVIDKETKQIQGILTRADLFRAYRRHLDTLY
jgi:CIC family chloride channel protein